MNSVWNIPYVRWPSFWKRYVRNFGVIGLLGLAVVSSTALTAFATAVAHGAAAPVLAVAASLLVNLGLFLLATVFWEILQLIGTWYVTRGLRNASPTYGVFAVVITLLSWLYLGSQLTLWAAEINVVHRYHLWPRSVIQPPLTRADRLVLRRLAQMAVRRPEEEVTAPFTNAAYEDPLDGGL